MNLVNTKEQETETKKMSAEDYWDKFVGSKSYMTYEEFTEGYRSSDSKASDDEIREAFDWANTDGNKRLSWGEF
jgi:Ca2+-binding EF-hand superfamily protein